MLKWVRIPRGSTKGLHRHGASITSASDHHFKVVVLVRSLSGPFCTKVVYLSQSLQIRVFSWLVTHLITTN